MERGTDEDLDANQKKHVCASGTGAFYFREAIAYLITRYQKCLFS